MANYYFAVAFQSDDPLALDGTHHEAQYGFGQDSGSGTITALGSSGSVGFEFETVSIPAGSGPPNQLVVVLCTDILGIDQNRSFFRCAFRPAHDVAPATNLPLAPVNQGDAQALLTGQFISAKLSEGANITNGMTGYGLPKATYETLWSFAGRSFISGQPSGTSLHFEISIEIAIVGADGTAWTYYKVDPEMDIDF